VPITLVGEPIGVFQLEREEEVEAAWTLDETELVNLVAARVARQVENLRLLAQAEHYRAEAESATRRLTREGWESYLEAATQDRGYVYDLGQVTPLAAAQTGNGSTPVSQALKVRDEAIGHLAVEGVERLDQEAADLLAKVAERLSAHIENLRLAEQTQAALVEQQRLLAEQAAIVSRLRELDQLKSSFLANMSHELRTPLNSILGFADVMLEGLDGPVNDQMDNDLRLISKNGQHLLSLINDVLDMAKIEAGKMSLVVESFDLREVLHEVTDIIGPLAREKSLDLQVQTDAADDLHLAADRVRLRQIMINLVNNAVKFTETGGVTLQAGRAGDYVQIAIRDTGAGIPPDQIGIIFEEFRQADTSTTRKAGGTGLGLPITKRLVELHGGRLWVESTGVPGEGSTFHIELPMHSTSASQPAAQATPAAVIA
jgi:signal transduction histidine kinase